MTLILNGMILRAVAVASGKGNIRQSLDGVRVEYDPTTESITYVATDGALLLKFTTHQPSGFFSNREGLYNGGFTIPPHVIANDLLKPNKTDIRLELTSLEPHIATVTHDDVVKGAMSFNRSDHENFPDWRRVLPTIVNDRELNPFAINGDLMDRMVKAGKIINRGRHPVIEILSGSDGGSKPIIGKIRGINGIELDVAFSPTRLK